MPLASNTVVEHIGGLGLPGLGRSSDPWLTLPHLGSCPVWIGYCRVKSPAVRAYMLESTSYKATAVLINVAAYLPLGLRWWWGAMNLRGDTWCESGSQATSTELGLCGQFGLVCTSLRQCGHQGIFLARPVNASLYRRVLGMDQLRSFFASVSRRLWQS